MKVNFYNTYLQGGAANGALNLFNLLMKKDIDGTFFYMNDLSSGQKLNSLPYKAHFFQKHPNQKKISNPFNIILHPIKARLHYKKLLNYIKDKPGIYEQFSFAEQYYSTPISWFGQDPDIVHLHWIAEWIDYKSFFNSIPNEAPIVWTLHDMNPFTGGCHYSWDCNQYKSLGCHNCPQLGPYKKGDIVAQNWEIKYNALKNKNLHIVGDSNWITDEAKKSPLFSSAKSFQTINYSIDFNIFKLYKNQQKIREKYKIPPGAFLVCSGSADINNRRKGFPELLEALKIIKKNNIGIHCIFFGDGVSSYNQNELPPIHFTGKLGAVELAEIYSASDLFIFPSLYEAFGLTAIESMACGTAVVAFDSGGIPDSVKEGTSGWLIKKKNSLELANKIIELIAVPSVVKATGESAISFVNENFNNEKEANAYLNLYRKIVRG
jgi:glycosyltransferase involved in cell wall biosynthesis